jgi:hypothetical protein
MRRGMPLLVLLASCGPARAPEAFPELPPIVDRRSRGDEVVALLDGRPLTWQMVAEKALELDLKSAVDQYVRWRIVEDRKAELKIENTPEERRERARRYVERLRTDQGEEAFRSLLGREGVREEVYRERLESSSFLDQILTFDKIVRYADLREDRLEADVAIFAKREDAQAFLDHAVREGFDEAARRLPTAAGLDRLGYARSRPPLDLISPAAHQKLLSGREGDIIGVETGPDGRYHVFRLRPGRPGRPGSYEELRGEVWRSIQSDPPSAEEYPRWMEAALKERQVQYGDRAGGKAGRP